MNILFVTLLDFDSVRERNIYTDLMREFLKNGHRVCIISPVERRTGRDTELINDGNCSILKLKIGNMQKTGLIEKGISTLTFGPQLKRGVKRYFKGIRFDLVLYPTPPITVAPVVKFVKKRDGARTYLMLKDIFPQNALDIGLLRTTGLKGFIYRSFKRKEKALYALSDKIGCMSPANVEYLKKHNHDIDPNKIEICPNCMDPETETYSDEELKAIAEKYKIPRDKTVFVYGGNLGKPQGIDFMMECIKAESSNPDVYFVIIGNGTEYDRVSEYIERESLKNVQLYKWLPREDFDRVVAACDVGLIFLDKRFTIPNYPSRLLSYLQASKPVLVCTDPVSDVGTDAESAGFGVYCESGDLDAFSKAVDKICSSDLKAMGEKGHEFMLKNATVKIGYSTIMKSIG